MERDPLQPANAKRREAVVHSPRRAREPMVLALTECLRGRAATGRLASRSTYASSPASSVRKARAGIAAPSSVRASGRSAFCGEGQ